STTRRPPHSPPFPYTTLFRSHECVVEGPRGTRRRANVRPNRHLHPDEAGQRRECGTECEGARRFQTKRHGVRLPAHRALPKNRGGEDYRKEGGDDSDRLVLAPQERLGPLLNRSGDLPHPLRARILSEDAPRQDSRKTEACQDRDRDDEAQVQLSHYVRSSPVSAAASSSLYLGFDGSVTPRPSPCGSSDSRGLSSSPSRGFDRGRRAPCCARRNSGRRLRGRPRRKS